MAPYDILKCTLSTDSHPAYSFWIKSQLKMVQPPVRLCEAGLLNAKYLVFLLRDLANLHFDDLIQKII